MTTAINPEVYMEPRPKAILSLCYDKNMLRVRQMLLEHFGYIVLSTTSVEAAKSVAQQECPDLLLMDNSHPGIDFDQVAAQIKSVCPAVLAVVLSPYYYGGRNGSGGAIDRFVAKDDGPDVLISQIEELFAENRVRRKSAPGPM